MLSVMMMRLINACNNRGDSVLHILGSSDDHFNVIALLVDLGADIHVRNVKVKMFYMLLECSTYH